MTARDDSGGRGGLREGGGLLALFAAVAAAVFVTTRYSLSFPTGVGGMSTLWIVNGLPLAALLRLPIRRWPLLVLATFIANVAAYPAEPNGGMAAVLVRAVTNVIQFTACAYFIRRKTGDYLDLTDFGHLGWLVLICFLANAARIGLLVPLLSILQIGAFPPPSFDGMAVAIFSRFVGMLGLALPILAITAREAARPARLDATDILLLTFLAGALYVAFGPYGFSGIFLVTPLLMLLAWRRGLLGAGIGTLLAVLLAMALSRIDGGLHAKLALAGYGPAARGIYMELFFVSSILGSLPLAVARARQIVMDSALADALSASRAREVQLAESEAAAREAEVMALQARERLRRVIETSVDLICTLDRDGRLIEVGANCASLSGWTREQVLGRPYLDFVHPDDREVTAQNMIQRMAGKSLPASRNRIIKADGSTIPMIWSASWDMEEGVCHAIGRDLTDYEALEAQARIAQRMEAIGQLTGGVAHDFNNLLTVVIGGSAALVEELDDPSQRRTAEMIVKAARQGSELTRQLLAFGRRQPLAPRPFDVNGLLDDMASVIRRTLGGDLDVAIETAANLRLAFADPGQTEAAILNLCFNARDAMPRGGKLTIATENRRLSEGYVRQHPDARVGDYVAVRVSDTGTGVATDLAERIFEPFFTTKDVGQGPGLGLSVVYGFLQQSGGHVDLVSENDRGATFTLYLPAADALADNPPPFSLQDNAELGDERVLIVEDDDLVREHVRRQFSSLGYAVLQAATGAEALDILRQRADVDLLFADVALAGGVDGVQLCSLALAERPALRIVYTSGNPRNAFEREVDSPGEVIRLSKPYSTDDLARKVRAALDDIPLPASLVRPVGRGQD